MSYRYSLTVKGEVLAKDATEGDIIRVISEKTGVSWDEFMAFETPLGNLYDPLDPTDLEEWTDYLLRNMPRVLLGRYASIAYNVKFYEVFLTREKKL